jgi:hypothetical protein
VDSYTAHATERVGAPHHFGRLPLFACFPTGNRPVRIRMPWWCGGRGLNTPGYPIRCQDHVTVVYLEALGPGTRNSLRRLPLQPGLHYLGDAIHLPPDLGIRILDCNLLGRPYEPCRSVSDSIAETKPQRMRIQKYSTGVRPYPIQKVARSNLARFPDDSAMQLQID